MSLSVTICDANAQSHYVLDSSQSSISVSFENSVWTAQAANPGSASSSLEGEIIANVLNDSFTILAGELTPTTFFTLSANGTGSIPGWGTANPAYLLGLSFALQSNTLSTSTEFPSEQVTVRTLDGRMNLSWDGLGSLFNGLETVGNFSGPNDAAGGVIGIRNGVETIRIPLFSKIDYSTTSSGIYMILEGEIVASRTLIPGDANRDGSFDSSDLIQVFQAGEYEDTISNNSDWSEGDWNGDGDFDSEDLVSAFASGCYENPDC